MISLNYLKSKKIWVLFKIEYDKHGNRTKVPYSYKNKKVGCTDEYKSEWCDFKTAMEYKEKIGAIGVGFVILKGKFFIDIDDRSIDDPEVKYILSLTNTYAEYSNSGKGIHIYGTCNFDKLPIVFVNGKYKIDEKYYVKNPYNKIEIYIGGATSRFAVFTGNAINNYDLNDGTEAVNAILNKHMLKANFKVEKFDIEEIIRLITKDKKGKKLFLDGDISIYNNDDSCADLALCNMIVYYVGDNIELIDKIFRRSKLYREKWEREDYRKMTIEKAIKAQEGNFNKLSKPHPYFIVKSKNGEPFVSVVLLAKYIKENYSILKVRNSGEEGMSIYVYNNGVYEFYDDKMLKGLIKKVIKDFDPMLMKIKDVNDAYQDLITDLDYVSQYELNNDESIINFKNCILKINKKEVKQDKTDISSINELKKYECEIEILPHSPKYLSTIQIPYDYIEEDKPTPYIDGYFEHLSSGDSEIKELLYEFYGMPISNIKNHRTKKSLFIQGSSNSGKSQYRSLIEETVGYRNCATLDLKDLEENRFASSAIINKRLIGTSDHKAGSVKEVDIFKQITGGDSIRYERKGVQAETGRFNGVMILCMNKFIPFGDRNPATYNRIDLIKCDNAIPEVLQDTELLEKMKKEIPYIIPKLVKAIINIISRGYRYIEPKKVVLARQEYVEINSPIIRFWKECMRKVTDEEIKYHIPNYASTGIVMKVYKAWSRDNNSNFAFNSRVFNEEIKEYLKNPNIIVHKTLGSFFDGYTLTDDAKKLYSFEYGHLYDDEVNMKKLNLNNKLCTNNTNNSLLDGFMPINDNEKAIFS